MESPIYTAEDLLAAPSEPVVSTPQPSPQPTPSPSSSDVDALFAKGLVGLDERVVADLKKYGQRELTVARVARDFGNSPEVIAAARALLQVENSIRTLVLQACLGYMSGVPAGPIDKVPTYGTADELRTALTTGKVTGRIQFMRCNPEVLLRLNAGHSGAEVRTEFRGKAPCEVWLTYGTPTHRMAEMLFVSREGLLGPMSGIDNFIRELVTDGHHVQKCVGTPTYDFFVYLFCCVYRAHYDVATKKYSFVERPKITELTYPVKGVSVKLLDPVASPFGAVLRIMKAHLMTVKTEFQPSEEIAWVWENCVNVVKLTPAYVGAVELLFREWNARYGELISFIQSSVTDIAACLSTLGNDRRLPQPSLADAITSLERYRTIRGKEKGAGAAAFLNKAMKQVGVDPNGVLSNAYTDIARYSDVLAVHKELGTQKLAVYTHHPQFELKAYYQERGMPIEVYTSSKGTPFNQHDFGHYGVFDHNADGYVVDAIAKQSGLSGEVTTVSEWNAHRKILEKVVNDPKIDNVAVFSRILTYKDGVVNRPDVTAMGELIKGFKYAGATIRGTRPHNGEYVLWLFKERPKITSMVVFDVSAVSAREAFFGKIVSPVVACRIVLGNEMRMWAVPCGAWAVQSIPFKTTLKGGREMVLDSAAYFRGLLSLRQCPEVLAARSQTVTKSTAPSFGEAKVNIEDTPAEFQAIMAAVGGPVLAASTLPSTLPVEAVRGADLGAGLAVSQMRAVAKNATGALLDRIVTTAGEGLLEGVEDKRGKLHSYADTEPEGEA